ncbi:MAG: CoA-binding protein [Candidatus Omnitrophica bacterium]|nr:CoA-binding protein [Candidatus Omnitrophota bacterium]MDD5670706.1 CoA-binding protein [Candidatus Omnitrophota bacterium]
MNVAVIGASNKPDRYSYKAVKLLLEKGHQVYPVHPRIKDIEGLPVYRTLRDIADEIHTVTLYVGAASSTPMVLEILACRPQRIIFNPGAENAVLKEQAEKEGILTVIGCTLVMLKTGQF